MMTWEIFLGISALISFGLMVGGPLLKLNTSITKLNVSIDNLKSTVDRIENDNKVDHDKIWAHNDEQDEKLDKHEERLTTIEHKINVHEIMHPELATPTPNVR